ncbi:hypothetical protein [Endozoicomonas sp. 8E]|uniref:hypothetical protein n=1 Tax=Endozoicomonas sp. 8E TaxID=3035692 RepID=UPI002938E45A|nr:hypothetical protein [Endozoicomonas sp. 8E]WOG29088.1 hypothetical protein P6910_05330 [Endozoicomonas sp. 8E]
MFGLIDTDAAYKLSCCRLLDEASTYLKLSGFRALEAMPHVVEKQIFGDKQYGYNKPSVRSRITKEVKAIPRMKEAHVEDVFLLSTLQDAFDHGEAFLLYRAIKDGQMLLVSGDKRFCKALGKKPEILKACSHLEGKMICLEHLILCLIESYQFRYVCDRVAPARHCDTTLRLSFNQGEESREASVVEALVSFSKDAVRSLGSLAYSYKPWYE